MIEEKKRLTLKMSVIVIGNFILFYALTLALRMLIAVLYSPLLSTGYDNPFSPLFHAIPLIKLLPAIPLSLWAWKRMDKLENRTLFVVVVVLILLILQPYRLQVNSTLYAL